MDTFLDFTWYNIIQFLFVLTVLVYIHEWGHYWVARRNNVRVEVFSIGFGPEIFGWTNAAGTHWKISAIPLGGYVKMLGQSDLPEDEEDEEPLSEEDKPFSFQNKTLAQRAAIVVAGPLANFLLAIVLFAGLIMIVGMPRHYAGVGKVMENSAAAEAGILGLAAKAAPSVAMALREISLEESLPGRVLIAGSLYLAGKVLAENG